MQKNLTEGSVTKTILLFSLPMIAGNLLQQLYNIADTLIVGRFLGSGALAAVGASYTLMTFLTSIFLGLCMGSGAVFSIRLWGERPGTVGKKYWSVFFINRNYCGYSKFGSLFVYRPDYGTSSGSTGNLWNDAGLFVGDFSWDSGNLFV